ncbi:MFS transporter [Flexilinea flocculi]|uniref:Fucose permease n=1 Tax=Flexilinea flocculi TaxID=1678840 RepID=A0A0S7BTA3_9CHLR|nr:MFS transporter [Flexilinea flocculi]GAP41691.1 fucose permease [Flexilinea flocculi]
MTTFFILIIYAAFISLGLPDSLLGTAWPLMQADFQVSTDSAGIISMIIAGGTIISSFFSSKIIRRIGTGNVTFISILMTAISLMGFHFAPSFFWLPIFAIPLGLGAGSIDAGLNEFVAEHYESRHMSWLHCFWGVGAMAGPILLSQLLAGGQNWRSVYQIVSIIQLTLAVVIFLTLPMWKKVARRDAMQKEAFPLESIEKTNPKKRSGLKEVFRLKGVVAVLLSVLFYCGTEQTMMLWGATYLIRIHEIQVSTAAAWISLFLGGITVGRFLSGFVTLRIDNIRIIRIGQITILIGLLVIILPLPEFFLPAGILLAGLGCAPIYPCILHETPVRFGKNQSQEIMGIQMAAAYTGSTFFPPIIGFIGARTSMVILPFFLFLFTSIMLLTSERVNHLTRETEIRNMDKLLE